MGDFNILRELQAGADLAPMFAIVSLVAATLALYSSCIVCACAEQAKERRSRLKRRARLESKDAKVRNAAETAEAPTPGLQHRLEVLRHYSVEVLSRVVTLERQVDRHIRNMRSYYNGDERMNCGATMRGLQAACFRCNLVVCAYVETLHEGKRLASDITDYTLQTASAETGTAALKSEYERLDRIMSEFRLRYTELSAIAESLLFTFNRASTNQSQQNSGLQLDISNAMKKLAKVAKKGTIPSPDSRRSLLRLLRAGMNDAEWGASSKNYMDLRTRALGCRDVFLSTTPVSFLEKSKTQSQSTVKKPIKRIWFPLCQQYPFFFAAYWIMNLAIFATWIARIRQQGVGMEPSRKGLGGFGVTFFGVPPQYNLATNPRQQVGVPIIYGFMHCALFSLGLLPLTMARGFIRDLSRVWIGAHKWIPIEHFVILHQRLGFFILFLIACGAATWLIVMIPDCLSGVEKSCLAFSPGVKYPASPVDNVMTLRLIVWSFWFPFLPLIHWTQGPPPRWVPSFFSWIRAYWFEIAFYSHILMAYGILILALIARFEVFWPMLLSWSIYFFDRIRETLWRPQRMQLTEKQIYCRKGETPNSIHLHWRFLPSTNCRLSSASPKFAVSAGQWVYVLIPEIDWNWHPFSVSSETTDNELELHIGIRKPAKTGSSGSVKHPTWTYKLLKLLEKENVRNGTLEIKGYVRGPYGSTFNSCYDPKFGGAVVIGAGTGITAAESVLRETLRRRREVSKTAVPEKFWFVWSCRCTNDLTWCFDRLVKLLVKACEDGVLEPSTLSNSVRTWDWLGITIYVSRTQDGDIRRFREKSLQSLMTSTPQQDPQRKLFEASTMNSEYTLENGVINQPRGLSLTHKVQDWLLGQLHEGSLDMPSTHILRHLRSCSSALIASGVSHKGLAIGFCGPSGLAHTLSEAVQQLEVSEYGPTMIQFSADHQ